MSSEHDRLIEVLEKIHAEQVRANALRMISFVGNVLNSPIPLHELEVARIELAVDLITKQRDGIDVQRKMLDEQMSKHLAELASEKADEEARAIRDAAPSAPLESASTDGDEPAYLAVDGPGPHMQGVRTVLVTSNDFKLAQYAVDRWRKKPGVDAGVIMIDTKERCDEWTKKVRIDPHVFELQCPLGGVLFVVGGQVMRPHNWRPAFDVIAVVIAGQNGLVYTLLKGRRGRE